jgi:hypothetical protein
LEFLNQNETTSFKYKSSEARRANQGVYLIFLKEEKTIDDYDLDELDTDMDSNSSDDELKKQDDMKTLVGYIAYAKQRDELETVCIKEICIHKDYKRRNICKHFVRRMCLNVFRDFGYKRVTFTASSFNNELTKICKNKPALIKRISSWTAWTLIPGIKDERTIYAFEIEKYNQTVS